MNKKKTLLLLTATSFAAVVMTIVVVGQNMNASAFEQTKANGPEYTLSLDKDSVFGTYPGKGGLGFTYTNSRGATFGFFKNSGVTKNSHDAALYSDGNQDNTVLIESSYNANESIVDSINGITSITVDFGGTYYQDEGTPSVIPTIYFGFVEGETAVYTHQHTLEDNVAYDFEGLLPSCFKIVISNATATSKWYRGWITSLNLTYSCSSSDTLKNHYFNNEYFDATPKNIVRDGEDNIVSFESGAYPQSKAESEVATYLEAHYEGMTPINTYYPYGPYLYARAAAWTTGYQNEYEYGNYYWFKVEPVKWLVLSHEGTSYFVMSEKAIKGDLQYNSSSSNVNYSNSTLKTSVDNMYNVMFKNADSLIATREKYTVSAIDYPINSKLYALSQSDYEGYSATLSERKALPTEFTRTTMNYNNIDTLDTGAIYWTNRVNYGWNGKNCAISESGVSGEYSVTMRFAVRPGMTITIA